MADLRFVLYPDEFPVARSEPRIYGQQMFLDLRTAPELTTPNLRLRLPTGDDLEAFASMLSDPAVAAPKGMDPPPTRDACWRGLANMLGHWALRGYGLFAVEMLTNGRFIGTIGVIRPEGWPGMEITWTVDRNHWGKGFATEGALAVRDWAFHALGVSLLLSLIAPDNTASLRVAEKIGFHFERDAVAFGNLVKVYSSPPQVPLA